MQRFMAFIGCWAIYLAGYVLIYNFHAEPWARICAMSAAWTAGVLWGLVNFRNREPANP